MSRSWDTVGNHHIDQMKTAGVHRNIPKRTFDFFMNLPPELRELVYNFYLPHTCLHCGLIRLKLYKRTYCDCWLKPGNNILVPDIQLSDVVGGRPSSSIFSPLLPTLALSCKQLRYEIAFHILRKTSLITFVHESVPDLAQLHGVSYFSKFLETISIPEHNAFDLITKVNLEGCNWEGYRWLSPWTSSNLDMKFMTRCANLRHVSMSFMMNARNGPLCNRYKTTWDIAETDVEYFAKRLGLGPIRTLKNLEELTLVVDNVQIQEAPQILIDFGMWVGGAYAEKGQTVSISICFQDDEGLIISPGPNCELWPPQPEQSKVTILPGPKYVLWPPQQNQSRSYRRLR